MINSKLPDHWRDLQNQVAQILGECGLEVESDKSITTAGGTVVVDAFAQDPTQKPPVVYICECKHWKSLVPKGVIHAFRTVISDFGANWGFIISSRGFQKGAYEAARHSNVRLLDWQEFQESFVDRWFQQYMVPRIREEADPLVEYTEPINSRIFRKADALPRRSREQFIALRKKYQYLGFLALLMYVPGLGLLEGSRRPKLPIKDALVKDTLEDAIPQDLLEARALRDFLEILLQHVREGIAEFDQVFGERA